jgi:arsenate reductase
MQRVRPLLGEYLGSALLTLVVVGSGIAAQQLSSGNVGLQLLMNALVTGCGLFVLIIVFGKVSGAQFNPAVSFVASLLGGQSWARTARYLPCQVAGCISGAVLGNYLFAVPQGFSVHHRASVPHLVAEVVATAGLILAIFAVERAGHGSLVPVTVATYITGAYFFTSSTSVANPAIAVGRMFTTSFAGIAPSSVAPFIGAQLVGALLGYGLVTVLYPLEELS